MTYTEIPAMLETSGVPCAYYQFPENTVTGPPFICFYFENNDDFIADNTNYSKIERLIVEVYTDEKDYNIESTVENILNAHGLVYVKDETYIDEEKMHETIYGMDVIITEE